MASLLNMGNTCAINSILQCISYTMPDNINSDKPFTKIMVELIHLMRNNEKKALRPILFLKQFYQSSKNIFQEGYQIDAPELWIFICNQVFKDTSIISQDVSISYLNDIARNAYTQIARHNESKISLWNDWYQGSTITIIKCLRCNTKTFNIEPFYEINLDPSDNIINMLHNYFSLQEKQDDWKCDKCNDNTKHLKSIKLWHAPKTLVICIKRYNNYMQKTLDVIKINKSISFGINSVLSQPNNNCKYYIKAIVNHHGFYCGGHYTSTIINDNNIRIYDDCSITNVEDNSNLWCSRNAYMLFYSMI